VQKPALIDELRARVTNSKSLETELCGLGAESQLFNVHLAFGMDLSHLALGQGLMIPSMVSDAPGGRRSVLELDTGQRVLTGVFVNGQTLALRYWTRESGGDRVAPGDGFREEWTSRSGELLALGTGQVEAVDHSVGEARIRLRSSRARLGIGDINLPPIECDCDLVVILWSAICWGDCKCAPAPEKKK
jgi:hypothetical protein